MKKKIIIVLLFLFSLPFLFPSEAYAIALGMHSANYQIDTDSINNAGVYSTSLNYHSEDTVGETGTGVSSSTNYTLEAGYQHLGESTISISSPGNITMPSIGGITGGFSTSSLLWTVITDNTAGYALYINATSTPALRNTTGGSFADYVPAGADPDYAWGISSSTSAFGFSPGGTDIIGRFKDNGSTCNTGSLDSTYACWDGLSTTTKLISQSAASNQPSGTATSLVLQAQVGSNKIQDSGTYSATITATAISL